MPYFFLPKGIILQTSKIEKLLDLVNTSLVKKDIIFQDHGYTDEGSSSDSSL